MLESALYLILIIVVIAAVVYLAEKYVKMDPFFRDLLRVVVVVVIILIVIRWITGSWI